jgi:hypothetical protein
MHPRVPTLVVSAKSPSALRKKKKREKKKEKVAAHHSMDVS